MLTPDDHLTAVEHAWTRLGRELIRTVEIRCEIATAEAQRLEQARQATQAAIASCDRVLAVLAKDRRRG